MPDSLNNAALLQQLAQQQHPLAQAVDPYNTVRNIQQQLAQQQIAVPTATPLTQNTASMVAPHQGGIFDSIGQYNIGQQQAQQERDRNAQQSVMQQGNINRQIMKERLALAKQNREQKATAARIKGISDKTLLKYFPELANQDGTANRAMLTPDMQRQFLSARNADRAAERQDERAISRQTKLANNQLKLNQLKINRFAKAASKQIAAAEVNHPGITNLLNLFVTAGDANGFKQTLLSARKNDFQTLEGKLNEPIDKLDFSNIGVNGKGVDMIYHKTIEPRVRFLLAKNGMDANPDRLVKFKDSLLKSLKNKQKGVDNSTIILDSFNKEFIGTTLHKGLTGSYVTKTPIISPDKWLEDGNNYQKVLDFISVNNPYMKDQIVRDPAAMRNIAQKIIDSEARGNTINTANGQVDPRHTNSIVNEVSDFADSAGAKVRSALSGLSSMFGN